jgi:hypothetical protein
MLWKIATTILVVWFFAGLIGLLVHSERQRAQMLVGLCASSVAVLSFYLWCG